MKSLLSLILLLVTFGEAFAEAPIYVSEPPVVTYQNAYSAATSAGWEASNCNSKRGEYAPECRIKLEEYKRLSNVAIEKHAYYLDSISHPGKYVYVPPKSTDSQFSEIPAPLTDEEKLGAMTMKEADDNGYTKLEWNRAATRLRNEPAYAATQHMTLNQWRWNKIKQVKAERASMEKLVLMPIHFDASDVNLQGPMEAALAEGLQEKFQVVWGSQVTQKTHEVFHKENIKEVCDEAKCLQKVSGAFQSELVATASVVKAKDEDREYFLTVTVYNTFDTSVVNTVAYQCNECDMTRIIAAFKSIYTGGMVTKRTPVYGPSPRMVLNGQRIN
jgi:hypothetical protein